MTFAHGSCLIARFRLSLRPNSTALYCFLYLSLCLCVRLSQGLYAIYFFSVPLHEPVYLHSCLFLSVIMSFYLFSCLSVLPLSPVMSLCLSDSVFAYVFLFIFVSFCVPLFCRHAFLCICPYVFSIFLAFCVSSPVRMPVCLSFCL